MSCLFKKIFSFCLPFGKADAIPSSALPRASGRRLQRRPWMFDGAKRRSGYRESWGNLDFRSIRVVANQIEQPKIPGNGGN
jgi:hypothetical protein